MNEEQINEIEIFSKNRSRLKRPETLMLIDDDSLILKLHTLVAHHVRIFNKVLGFHSGSTAFYYLADNVQTIEKLPTLILLDLEMPNFSGYDFIKSFAKLPVQYTDNCRIVVVSGKSDHSTISALKSEKFVSGFIKKPLQPNYLSEIISNFYEL